MLQGPEHRPTLVLAGLLCIRAVWGGKPRALRMLDYMRLWQV
jgi:hypothetical protein